MFSRFYLNFSIIPSIDIIGRWTVINNNRTIKTCSEKIESCMSLQWEDYSKCNRIIDNIDETKDSNIEKKKKNHPLNKYSSDDLMMIASML